MSAGVVIVGAGQAGAQTAISLREQGYLGGVSLIGDEPHGPYHRPPLSKDYLAGKIDAADLGIRSTGYFEEQDIWLRTGSTVTAIRRDEKKITLATGEELPYEHLVLATGARSRPLPVFDGDPANVHYLRTREDAERLRSALGKARNILVVGAGFIGMEFASVAAAVGARVTVADIGARIMQRAVSEPVSAHFAAAHARLGTEILTGTAIDEFVQGPDGRVTAFRIGSQVRPTDLVLVGIGVIPNSALAAEAGLAVGDGITVDPRLRTSDPSIYAIGDCGSQPRPEMEGHVRIESVQNAADQARFIAARLTGQDSDYADLPWFWSHQAGARLQIAGLARPDDECVFLGHPGDGKFSVCRVRDGRLVAVESINQPGEHLAARRLLSAGTAVSAAELRLPGFSLRAAAAGPALART